MDKTATSIDTIAKTCIAGRLRLLNRVVTNIYDDALRPLGLKISRGKMGVASPVQVCEYLQLDISTLSRNVELMRKNGWLEEVPGEEIGSSVRFVGGGIAITLGALVVVQGARTFWRNKTTINPVDLESASALVTSGVFRYSRNPMYVGFTVMLVGWAVSLAAPWALLGPLAFVLFTNRFQIIPEERVMRAKFGQAYDDYRAQVRRWI